MKGKQKRKKKTDFFIIERSNIQYLTVLTQILNKDHLYNGIFKEHPNNTFVISQHCCYIHSIYHLNWINKENTTIGNKSIEIY